MTPETIETEILDRLVPELAAEGYEVYLHPNKALRPSFLGEFSPDAIAFRSDKNLVVEVLRKSNEASKTLSHVRSLLQGHDRWELRVVWVDPAESGNRPEVQKADAIRAHIVGVRSLTSAGHLEAALLMAWATFEALARALIATQFQRPQTPGRLVEVLAAEGYLTPTEADMLRKLAAARNRLAHGELDVQATRDELAAFAKVLQSLLPQLN